MDLLWSINDQLRGGTGLELDRLSESWLDDLIEMGESEAESGTTSVNASDFGI